MNELAQQRLQALQSATDLASYKKAEQVLADISRRDSLLHEEYRWLGRPTAQEEAQIDPQRMEKMAAIWQAIREQNIRLHEIDAVRVYLDNKYAKQQAKQDARQVKKPDVVIQSYVDAIQQDREKFLADINQQLDGWNGYSDRLVVIKQQLDHLLYLQPEWAEAHIASGRYYLCHAPIGNRNKDIQKSLQALDRAQRLAPDNAQVRVYQALAHLRFGTLVYARMLLKEARAMGDDSSLQHRLWVNIHNQRDELDAARKELALGLEKAENRWQKADFLQAMSWQALFEGKPDAAIEPFRQAVQLNPDFAWMHGNQAWYLLSLAGDEAGAKAQVEAARAIFSYGMLGNVENDLYYFRLARILREKNILDLYGLWRDRNQRRISADNMMARVGHYRVPEKAAELIDLLEWMNVSVNQSDADGNTALHVAAQDGNLATAQLLLQRGADQTLKSRMQQTAFFTALEHGRQSVALLLLQQGADPQIQNSMTVPALHQASYQGMTQVVAELLKRGLDVNQEYMGETPLSNAISSGQLDTVKLLLAQGANREFKPQGRWTLADLARETRQPDMLALLEDQQALKTAPAH